MHFGCKKNVGHLLVTVSEMDVIHRRLYNMQMRQMKNFSQISSSSSYFLKRGKSFNLWNGFNKFYPSAAVFIVIFLKERFSVIFGMNPTS